MPALPESPAGIVSMTKKFDIPRRLAALAWICALVIATGPATVPATVPASVSAQSAAPAAPEIRTKIDEYMIAAVAVNGFSGSILVARNGEPVASKAYGMANLELAVPNTTQTVFRLGSITKQFTATAIMMLQERGKLRVSDSICAYLTPCAAAWQPLTIRHLLTHTSGIPSYTGFPDFPRTTVLPTSAAEMIDRLKDKPLEFAPGEKVAYSNSGYYLLGLIIERASGMPYADFLQTSIFTPLGMDQTGYDISARIIRNRAAGYARQAGETVNAAYMDMSVPYAAGALYSTTEDLLRWDRALYTETLVSRTSLDEMFTPEKGGYGYGWMIGTRLDRPVIAHGGGIYGFAAHIARYPDDRVTVIVLSNVEGAAAGRTANDLAAIVFGVPYEIPRERTSIAVEPGVLDRYVGRYRIAAPPIDVVVTRDEGRLVADIGGQMKLALDAESDTVFFSRDVSAEMTFVTDAAGRVTGLMLRMGGGELPAERVK
jgi:CubicO group peptidase (beta-lactamase class C family)